MSEVIVLDKLTYAGHKENLGAALEDPRVSFIQGDICDFALVNKVASKVDAIINFAAESHVDRSIESSAEFVRTNVLGTQTLLDAARTHQVNGFLQVSTDEVYGSIENGSWDENCPLLPNSPYSASKAAADLLVRSYNITHGLRTITTRCSNNYGPRQFPEKLIPLFVTRLLNGEKVPVYGTGNNIRDWLHVNDHCSGIYIALTKGVSGEIYNIGGGTELTNISLTKKIIDLMGYKDNRIEFVPDRLGHDQRYSVNWSKIRELGYEPHHNFDLGLKETISWISRAERKSINAR
jgi:dTDP-glucose 4,6-dehydratase